MNSYPLSEGKNFRLYKVLPLYVLWSSVCALLLGCATTADKEAETMDTTGQEFRLQEDREKLKELRKEIPPAKQQENDEIAFFLNLMGEVKDHPSKVRQKFQKITRKKREKFQKSHRKKRTEYSRNEKKARDARLKAFKASRENFKNKMPKPTRDETKEFFNEINLKRKDFFAEQRENRKEFESDMRDKEKEFYAYMREKNNEFNALHRDYTKIYYEKQRRIREQKKLEREMRRQKIKALQNPPQPNPNNSALKEFEEMNSVPSKSLSPDDQ